MYWGIRIAIPLSALVCYGVLLGITAKQGLKKAVNRFFALYLLSIFVWSFGAVMMYVDPQNALLWNKVMLSGLIGMPVAFFGFVRAFLAMEGQVWWLYLGYASYIVLLLLNARGYLTEYVYFTEEGLIRYQFGPAVPLFEACSAFFLGFAALRLVQGYRQTKDAVERNRIRYAFLGISAVVLGTATNLVPALGAYPIDIGANVINALLLTYAISRYQLLDVTLVVRRSLAYAITIVSIAAGYLLSFFVLEILLHVSGEGVIVAVFAIAVAIALAFPPLRERAQLWIDRLFFREKYDSRKMLQELSQTTTSLLEFDELTTTILDKVAITMGISKIGLLLEDEATGAFHMVVQKWMPEDTTRLTLRKDHPLVHYLSKELLLTWHDTEVLPQFRALWTQEREELEKLGAKLFVSLKVKGKLVGVFAFGPKLSEETYSLDDQLTLATLANQVAIAIENARLYEAERTRATQLALISEVGRKAAILDLDTLMQEVTCSIQESFHYYNVALFLVDDKRREVVMRAVAGGFEPMVTREYRQPLDKGIIGFVARTGSSWLANDVSKDPYYIKGFLVELLTKSELCVPIRLGDKVIGVLDMQSIYLNAFGQEDVVTVEVLADRIAIAIENARLYAAAQQELAERKRAEEQTKAALAEKEMLLREVHHRVKNNLQAIISLISMQAEQTADARIAQSLQELQERAYAMALVYEQLYQSENLAQISVRSYLQNLSAHVFQAFGGGRAIKLSVEATPVSLDVETALPCGLIVNELLTNALKYSFPGGSKDGAEVRVEFRAEDATYTLVVSDNGVGLPSELDWHKARTMGLRLVHFWATHQLGGKLEVDNRQGTAFQVTFGEQPKRQRPG